jgi:SAM-dependent methyltransferase
VGAVLHVGCGGDPLPAWLSGYAETRLDIDPGQCPDVCASMLDMGEIGAFDVVFCQHALEHVAPHEVPRALSEFRRVLKPGGHAIVFVPDLEGVTPTRDVILDTPAGGVSGHDLFYGFAPALESNPYMAHRCGFVAETLGAALDDAGFEAVSTQRLGNFNLLGAARK